MAGSSFRMRISMTLWLGFTSEAKSTPVWSTTATWTPRGMHGTQGRLQGVANSQQGASTRNKSTRGTNPNYIWGVKRRSKQRWLGACQIVRCLRMELAKPCNPTTTHTLSHTWDRNTTKCTPQRNSVKHDMYKEVVSGVESAPLGVKDNTTKPCAYKDGSSSHRGPMVAMGIALHNNGWNKHRLLCKSMPKLCMHPPHHTVTETMTPHN